MNRLWLALEREIKTSLTENRYSSRFSFSKQQKKQPKTKKVGSERTDFD